MQEESKEVVLDGAQSPFLGKVRQVDYRRKSRNSTSNSQSTNCVLKTGNKGAKNDFQFIYWRYFKYKHMMETLKSKIMEELERRTEFDPQKQEIKLNSTCFDTLTKKLGLVTDKLAYYAHKLKMAGVEVDDQELQDLTQISPKPNKERKPVNLEDDKITVFQQSLEIPGSQGTKWKLHQKVRSISTMPEQKRRKRRLLKSVGARKSSIDYTNQGPVRLPKSIVIKKKQKSIKTVITINDHHGHKSPFSKSPRFGNTPTSKPSKPKNKPKKELPRLCCNRNLKIKKHFAVSPQSQVPLKPKKNKKPKLHHTSLTPRVRVEPPNGVESSRPPTRYAMSRHNLPHLNLLGITEKPEESEEGNTSPEGKLPPFRDRIQW